MQNIFAGYIVNMLLITTQTEKKTQSDLNG